MRGNGSLVTSAPGQPKSFATCRDLQARDHAQRRRLPASAGAEQDDELAFFDRQIDSLDGAGPVGIGLAKLVEGQKTHDCVHARLAPRPRGVRRGARSNGPRVGTGAKRPPNDSSQSVIRYSRSSRKTQPQIPHAHQGWSIARDADRPCQYKREVDPAVGIIIVDRPKRHATK